MKNVNHEILKQFNVSELEDRFELKSWFGLNDAELGYPDDSYQVD